VLGPEGRLVVVTPADEHLRELVGPLGLLRVDPDKAARLAAALEPHLRPVDVRRHQQGLRLSRSAVATLVGMGPHARHLSRDRVGAALTALPEPVGVTIAVDVATYVRAGR
jgi:23S rRNA (guanine745-N1)-methyltransferase